MVFLEIGSCWMSGHVVWPRQSLIQPWMDIFDGIFVWFGVFCPVPFPDALWGSWIWCLVAWT